MNQSEQLDKFGAAFVAAQANMTNPHKDASNTFHHSKYASLEECNKQAHQALNAHDIGIIQGVHDNKLRTTLIHNLVSGFVTRVCRWTASKTPRTKCKQRAAQSHTPEDTECVLWLG